MLLECLYTFISIYRNYFSAQTFPNTISFFVFSNLTIEIKTLYIFRSQDDNLRPSSGSRPGISKVTFCKENLVNFITKT